MPPWRTDPETLRQASDIDLLTLLARNQSTASRGCDRPEPGGDPASGLRQAHRPPWRFSLADGPSRGRVWDSEGNETLHVAIGLHYTHKIMRLWRGCNAGPRA